MTCGGFCPLNGRLRFLFGFTGFGVLGDIGMNQKTVQMALMELVSTRPDAKWKKIGRDRLFWKEKTR
jgi:hypothetical protein